MRKALIISFTKLDNEPRVQRQIASLEENYQLDTMGFADPQKENIYKHFSITKTKLSFWQNSYKNLKLLIGMYESVYFSNPLIQECIATLKTKNYDLVIANDIQTLPLALHLFPHAKVVLDAHEYAPKQYEDNLHWRIFYQKYTHKLCQTYIPQTDLVFAVGQNIIDEYKKEIGIQAHLITNAPYHEELEPQLLQADTKKIRIIHHGLAGRSRHIEEMIYIADYLDERFELNFILLEGNGEYIQELKDLAKERSNINFLEPFSMQEIARKTNMFDIGLFLLKPVNFNYTNALPNKFFEFIQARLAIAIGPSPEMKRITDQEKLGVVSDEFSAKSLAQELNKLSIEQINNFKLHSHQVAHQYSFEANKTLMLKSINALFTRD